LRNSSPRSIIERIACLIALPLLAAGIYSTLRLAYADAAYRANTTESVRKAIRLEDNDADYHALLAEHLEGESQNPEPDRMAAIRFSPLESKHWIRQAFSQEMAGNETDAEKLYLHAADVDKMFTPRWTLMNFYFRRHDSANFWLWTRRAFQMAYGDQTSAFRLCWLMTEDAYVIESMLPPSAEIRRGYLEFLLATHRFKYLSPLDREVAESAEPADVPWLVGYCERTVAVNSLSAVDVWNILCRRGFKPFAPLAPEKGAVVTNADFRINPVEQGFDWRIPVVSGAQVSPRSAGRGMSVELNGNQPESCVILFQTVPLSPGKNYRMSYEYASEAASPYSGLTWVLRDVVSHAPFVHSEALKITGDVVSGQTDFAAGSAGAAELALSYNRAPGTVRHEEALTLRGITIRAQP
jgi:hypothetical protein